MSDKEMVKGRPRVRVKADIERMVEELPEATNLNEAQALFCKEYVFDYNATRAYAIAYPRVKADQTIRVNASRLLTNANVQFRIRYLKENLEESVGISRERVLQEHMKMAFSSIAHLHNTWIERKDFDKLTKEQKDSIQEIITQTRYDTRYEGEEEIQVQIDFVKIKLYDKQKALDSISKMVGYDAPKKLDLTSGGDKIGFGTTNVQVNIYTSGPPLAGSEKDIKD